MDEEGSEQEQDTWCEWGSLFPSPRITPNQSINSEQKDKLNSWSLEGKDQTELRTMKMENLIEETKLEARSRYLSAAFDDDQLARWFKEAEDGTNWLRPRVDGKLLHRKAAWFTEKTCRCSYKYSKMEWEANEIPGWLSKITNRVMEKLKQFSASYCFLAIKPRDAASKGGLPTLSSRRASA